MDRSKLQAKKPITDDHYVPLDEETAGALVLAEQRLSLAQLTGDGLEAAQDALKAAQDAVRETGLHFHIQAVGRLRFEELAREHPSDDDNKAFDPETFWPALFEESIVSELTAEEWRSDFFDSSNWNAGEVKALRDKVERVNTANRVAELGN